MGQTKELFSKQMTRKEFLQFAGMALLAVFGVKNFVAMLRDAHIPSTQKELAKSDARRGFGSSKFGV